MAIQGKYEISGLSNSESGIKLAKENDAIPLYTNIEASLNQSINQFFCHLQVPQIRFFHYLLSSAFPFRAPKPSSIVSSSIFSLGRFPSIRPSKAILSQLSWLKIWPIHLEFLLFICTINPLHSLTRLKTSSLVSHVNGLRFCCIRRHTPHQGLDQLLLGRLCESTCKDWFKVSKYIFSYSNVFLTLLVGVHALSSSREHFL